VKCETCGGVVQADGCRLCPMFATGATPGGKRPSTYQGFASRAMAVHRSQVAEADERNRRHGVNVRYDPATGNAMIPDAGERKKLMKLEGMVDHDSFT
jgi:hypothetical protein